MSRLLQDLRFGARMLRKNPVFAVVAASTLAIGIGANTAIFTVANGFVLRPLPYPQPDRLVVFNERIGDFDASVAYLNFMDWRAQNATFEELGALRVEDYNLTGDGEPARLQALEVSAGLLRLLEARPAAGRLFTEDEDRPGAPRAALLSYGLWSRRYGQDPGVVGRSIQLDDQPYTVVGALGPGFDPRLWGDPTDVFVPIGLKADTWTNRGNHPGISVIGRTKPGISQEQARADFDVISERLARQYPDSNTGSRARLRPLHEAVVDNYQQPLYLLMGAVGFLLLIVCANVANLMLTRAAARQPELAVRKAMGAGAGRLVRQVLTESLLIAVVGAGLGVLLAWWGVSALLAALPEGALRADEVRLDGAALAFTAGVACFAALLFGVAPAFHARRINLNQVLREGAQGSGGGRRSLFRQALIVAEVGLAVVLLVGSSLMMRSFWNVLEANPGFNPSNLLIARFSLPQEKYPEREARAQFTDRLLEQVDSLPGVASAGMTIPLLGGWQQSVYSEGEPIPRPGDYTPVDYASVTPDLLETLQVRLVDGRFFTDFDDQSNVIVDETFAQTYWPNASAVGKRVKMGGHDSDQDWSTIVGVVSHVKNYGVDAESRIEIYLPTRAAIAPGPTLVMRTDGDPEALATRLRSAVAQVDPELPVYSVMSMRDLLADRVAPRRLASILMALFALAALLLAAVGIYGVLAYSVSQRSREIGLRLAIGAQPAEVRRMVVIEAARLAGLGLALGLGAAFALSSLLRSLVFQVSTTDVPSYTAVTAVLALTALLAASLPALRASRVDPMTALRYE